MGHVDFALSPKPRFFQCQSLELTNQRWSRGHKARGQGQGQGVQLGGEARLAKPMLQLRKTKKLFANFSRAFWRFPTQFQLFKK